jgi:CelD/BcsL family acetyltransferase involved in cellulose biosynthesis
MSPEEIEVRRIDSLSDLQGIGEEWDALQAACPEKHVLLDRRWVTAWWRHLGGEKALHVLLLRRGGVTVGIAPLMISRGCEVFPCREPYVQIAEDFHFVPAGRWRRVVPVRRLTFPLNVSSNNGRAHILMAEPDPAVLKAVVDYCRRIAGEWDLMVLEGLPASSGQAEELRRQAASGGLRNSTYHYAREVLRTDLPRTMEEFLARRSSHFRKRLRQAINQAERRVADLGKLRVREFRSGDIQAGLEKLMALESQSWKVKEERRRRLYVRLDDRLRSFYREVAETFARTDSAQVLLLEVGDEPAAGLFSLDREGVIACVLTFISEPLSDRVSNAPLWKEFVERAIDRGLREIDFNGKTRNTMKWADDCRVCQRVMLFNRRPYSRLLEAVWDASRAVSRLLKVRSSETAAPAAAAELP